jgi:DNA-directed RNA polymerase specialized sigma24 family protein
MENSRASWLATTHWSVILAARDGTSDQVQTAMDTLCRTYWYPLYTYVRRRGLSPADSEDVIQAFFAHWMEQPFLRNVHPEKGRFRSFLLVCLKRFMTDGQRRECAAKRGCGKPFLSWDALDVEQRYMREPSDLDDAEALYERRWAITLLERVLSRLEQEFATAGKQELFHVLQPFLAGDKTDFTYREAGDRLRTTEGAVRMSVLRMRERYRKLFREEIANTVSEPGEFKAELRYIISVLSR